MQVGIAGSASIEGTSRTSGIVNGDNSDVTKRAVIFWIAAVALLAAFHVGGSRL